MILAENGEQAVRVFREQANAIALVLLDLTMPVMGGEEAARYLHTIRHDVPILVSSGYNESEVARRFAGSRVSGYVRKPLYHRPPAESHDAMGIEDITAGLGLALWRRHSYNTTLPPTSAQRQLLHAPVRDFADVELVLGLRQSISLTVPNSFVQLAGRAELPQRPAIQLHLVDLAVVHA